MAVVAKVLLAWAMLDAARATANLVNFGALGLDPVGLSQCWGYDAERHHVTTEDGYILGIHRITGPSGARNMSGQAKPVVILGHPLLYSSAYWTAYGPGRALGYLLADEGFDVWMLNVRGNTYSLNHTKLSTDSPDFWDFSFHEHGTQDLPALIQYAMRATGARQVQYAGLSMGTTAMFVMAAERPDVARHVQLFAGLGPVTQVHPRYIRSTFFRTVLETIPMQWAIAAKLGKYSFLPYPNTPVKRAPGEVHGSHGTARQAVLCALLVDYLGGRNGRQQMNAALLPYITSRWPAGTSYKNIDHYRQTLTQGFQKYNYGTTRNRARYGQDTPPRYNVSSIFVPTRLYYGLNDEVADPTDILRMCGELPNLLSCEAVADPLWTHMDFVWAKQIPELVYRRVVADIKKAASSA